MANGVKNPCSRKVAKNKHWFNEKTGVDTCVQMVPDWGGKCEVCGQKPIVPSTGMCGPCTFGEAETANGNW